MDRNCTGLSRLLPILCWGRSYSKDDFSGDLTAALIVTIMLIPQSLAYALLAGLPPQTGIYASILPLIAYALFGTSRALAVGPVAVVSLMTASALKPLGLGAVEDYLAAAAVLALLSGLFLAVMGFLKLGVIANLLSHPVIAGFITASGLLIAASQLKHLLGTDAHGHTLPAILASLWSEAGGISLWTLATGTAALLTLCWIRWNLSGVLTRILGIPAGLAGTLARIGPVLTVAGSIALSWAINLPDKGVAVVGSVPTGLPHLRLPVVSWDILYALAGPAALISVIGYVESMSVAQTLAVKRRQRIEANQELKALGAANIAAGLTGGYPVTGGFARSVVNFDAGARTPAAGAFTAIALCFAAMYLTPLLYFLPKAVLAATIILAVLSLVDLSILARAWRYSKADFTAVFITITATLIQGVEAGVALGIATSLLLFLWKTSRPHVAEVGRVPGTEHFRNINRHKVLTSPHAVTLRIDESLYFANARRMEDLILARVSAEREKPRHVILMCSAVNEIDLSALESLEAINERLSHLGIQFHLSEVKGPVMDRLQKSRFLGELTGKVFLSQSDAFDALAR